MQLFGYYRSSATYRIRIVLNVKKVDWQYHAVDLTRNEQQAEQFRSINPAGLVPVLDTGEALLAQSAAIAEYLDEKYPQPPLFPADPVARAQVREMMHSIGCDIHPLQNLRVLRYLRSEYSQDDDGVAQWCCNWIATGFAIFEKLAAKHSTAGKFCYGDTLTMADAWLVPQVYNARRYALDLAPYPLITAIDAHCTALPAFTDAHPDRQSDSPSHRP